MKDQVLILTLVISSVFIMSCDNEIDKRCFMKKTINENGLVKMVYFDTVKINKPEYFNFDNIVEIGKLKFFKYENKHEYYQSGKLFKKLQFDYFGNLNKKVLISKEGLIKKIKYIKERPVEIRIEKDGNIFSLDYYDDIHVSPNYYVIEEKVFVEDSLSEILIKLSNIKKGVGFKIIHCQLIESNNQLVVHRVFPKKYIDNTLYEVKVPINRYNIIQYDTFVIFGNEKLVEKLKNKILKGNIRNVSREEGKNIVHYSTLRNLNDDKKKLIKNYPF